MEEKHMLELADRLVELKENKKSVWRPSRKSWNCAKRYLW